MNDFLVNQIVTHLRENLDLCEKSPVAVCLCLLETFPAATPHEVATALRVFSDIAEVVVRQALRDCEPGGTA